MLLYRILFNKCGISTSTETWEVYVEQMWSYSISVWIITLFIFLNPTVKDLHEEINEINHRALVQPFTTQEMCTCFFFSYHRFSSVVYLSCAPCTWQVSELMLLAGDQWSSLVSCVLGSCLHFVSPLFDLSDAAITSFLNLSSIMDHV